MLKFWMSAFMIMFTGCYDYSNVSKVCVNYLEKDSYCGTGFFIDMDTLVTANHILTRTNDNILTAVGPGVNETSHDFEPLVDQDSALVFFDKDVSGSICPVCPDVKFDVPVKMLGVTGVLSQEIRERTGILEKTIGSCDGAGMSHSLNCLVIKGEVPRGFSGGPIIDDTRDCVIGVIYGTKDGYTYGGIITDI